MPEPLSRLLAELPLAELDPAQANRVRMRCRARLARPVSRDSAVLGLISLSQAGRIWQPLAVLLGVIYLVEVIVQSISLYQLL